MSDNNNHTNFGDRAQEMLMLDMLDGMHEFFTQAAYRSSMTNSFEIISDKEEFNLQQNTNLNTCAEVISFSQAKAQRMACKKYREKSASKMHSGIKT